MGGAARPFSHPPRPLLLPRLHSRSALLKDPRGSLDRLPDSAADDSTPTFVHIQERGTHPWGLRPALLFPLSVYPFAIIIDLILRLTWSAKLSSHLHSFAEGDLVIFWIELAEVVRRWLWVFLRVEWELVKETTTNRDTRTPPPAKRSAGLGPGAEDPRLGDIAMTRTARDREDTIFEHDDFEMVSADNDSTAG